jgi:tail sheath protein
MTETLHPDVYTIERGLTPTIVGVSTSTAFFAGTARRGPTDELGFTTSFREFQRLHGENQPDSFLEDAAFLFFQNGGRRLYTGRVVGAGALRATANLPSLAGAASAPVITSGNAETYALADADQIDVSVDGGGAQSFVVNATRAVRAGAGLAIVDLTGLTLLLTVDGGTVQTVTFAGTETTAALVAQAINSQIVGGSAAENGGEVDIQSDTLGTGSDITITGGTSLGEIGHSAGSTTGTGNVVNVAAVTAAEIVTIMAALVGAVASDASGSVRITHSTPGASSTLEVQAAPAAFAFPAGVVSGSASAPIDIIQIDAINEGSWGDGITITTERWRALTTAVLSTTETSIALNDVSKVSIGDVVTISDGTTTTNVHVNAINVATKTISFNAVTLTAPIASGALANSASMHRSSVALALDAAAADTTVTLTTISQLRVGSEVSLDNGTTTIFRVVTSVNGNKVTFSAAMGTAMVAGTPVVSQHFGISVSVDNEFDKTTALLSMQDTDTRDWIELRLNGTGNESLQIEAIDLAPAIATPIEARPAPVVNLPLTSGADGAVPTDNDYIGNVEPASGLQLVNSLRSGDVNIVAVPGIGTVLVQQALSDLAEARQDVIALIDPPLSLEQPAEVRDWRLNQHNRGTSYSALYYPWVTIRDRHSTSQNARKSAPPSGAVAGLYARVDAEGGPWIAPGNRGLLEVIEPVVEVANGQQDILNPIGINVLRDFPGEGTRIWGVRTLSNVADGRHYVNVRRLLNFVKVSVSISLRPYVFAGIDPKIFGPIARAVEGFLRTVWLGGGLFPSTDFSEAQYVKVDLENNPLETRRLGQLNVDAGINPPFPAEFIIFRIGLFDGEAVVDEVVS